MAESQKGAASTVKSKEKDSLLDLDIGNDFLKSLKSMSMGNDAMDFDFGPISKNKKKTFNFDKEDMDFNLDSDFGKISSFNIDMPDLDISSPCKKDRKSRESSKKESKIAINKKKGDDFNFSFDFELDNFGFGSSQESREKAKNNQEKDSFSFGSSEETGEKANNQEKECSSKKSGNEGSGSHLNEDLGSLEDRTAQKHGASEAGMSLTIDSHIDMDKNHDTTKHSLPSNHTMSNNDTSKLQSVNSEVALEKAKISLQEKISTSTQEAVFQVEETSLISRSESRSDTSSGLQQHVNSAADVTFFGVGTDVNKKVLLDSDKNYDKTVLESLSLEDVATSLNNAIEKSILENDKHVFETNKNRTQTHSNSMYIANATEDKMQDEKVGNEIQSPTSELSASSLSNGIVAEDLTAGKRRDAGVIRPKFFMPSIKPAAQMQKTASLTETKLSEFGNKRVGSITQSPSDEIIPHDNKDDGTGSEAGFPTDSGSLPKINPLQTGSQESHQVLGITIKFGAKPETSRTMLQKNMKSSKTVDQHGGFKAILQAKDNNCTERLKQMPANLSIKRKVPETNLDLTILLPSKRLSHSPSESRGSSEGTERIWHKQVNDHEHSGNGNKTSDYENCHISSRDVPMENIKELGRPFAIEDDDNIKKAEALSKDLDDMCSMLRKKQEEAKELLVRAVVNNNKLLLLNHPIYEEKIHRVQKFAAELMMRYQLAISH